MLQTLNWIVEAFPDVVEVPVDLLTTMCCARTATINQMQTRRDSILRRMVCDTLVAVHRSLALPVASNGSDVQSHRCTTACVAAPHQVTSSNSCDIWPLWCQMSGSCSMGSLLLHQPARQHHYPSFREVCTPSHPTNTN